MSLLPVSPLRHEPFSRFGSYLSFSFSSQRPGKPPPTGTGLYLCQHHGSRLYPRELALVLADDQEPIATWHEACLFLESPDGGRAEIVFDGTDGLRLRGRGLALTLRFPATHNASMYPARDGAWEVNARGSASKVLLRALRGTFEAITDWQGEASGRIEARISATDGDWELALDHFHGTWTPRPRPPFDELRAGVAADFARWHAALPPPPPVLARAQALAAYVNWSATVRPHGHFRRPAMLMSKNHMDNVWSWDHAFNAMAQMRGTPDLAWDQMMLMADRQDVHGAFPDAQNDVHEHFAFCKPPIHGWALGKLRAMRPDFFDAPRLREALSWLEPWTRWWLNHRVWEDGGLPYYLHGNDSGWDNSTFFLKGVPVLTPDLPCFLVLQSRELAEIHRLLGQGVDAAFWTAQADRLLAMLLAAFWNGERFVAKHLPSGERLQSDTLIETVPLVLGAELPAEIRTKVVARLHRYLTPHGLATEWPESPHYTPDGYWRGPIWAPSTYLIVDGLRRGGESALAEDIATRYLALCDRSGFAENFDALTGAPLRDKAYTWTASVFLLLAAGA